MMKGCTIQVIICKEYMVQLNFIRNADDWDISPLKPIRDNLCLLRALTFPLKVGCIYIYHLFDCFKVMFVMRPMKK